jgi:hypothetical protein
MEIQIMDAMDTIAHTWNAWLMKLREHRNKNHHQIMKDETLQLHSADHLMSAYYEDDDPGDCPKGGKHNWIFHDSHEYWECTKCGETLDDDEVN